MFSFAVGAGIAMCVIVLIELVRARAPRLPAPIVVPALPDEGPYRKLAEGSPSASDPAPTHVGPWRNCPQCGGPALRCGGCWLVRTDVTAGATHIDPQSKTCGVYLPDPTVYLRYTCGTSMTRLCSPQRRVRVGFFGPWCDAAGLHVHQCCQRCGWEGVAYVGRMEVSTS